MPLKLKLAAHERLIVNGAVMVNGNCRTTLVIRNFAHIMREKDVLQEPDANTPTKRLYYIMQAMLMQPPASEALIASYQLAHSQLSKAYERPENLAVLVEVDRLVGLGDYYKAMMKLQPLIAYEAELLNVPRQEWRRAGQREQEITRPPSGPMPGSLPSRYPTSDRAPNAAGSAGLAVAAY
jgi:flagellar protein FlbT